MRLFPAFIIAPTLCLGAAPTAADMRPAEEIAVAQTGFAARLYSPPSGQARRTAVIMLGGSDGGYPSSRAALDLAQAGHPVLALAYSGGFAGKIAGLPERIERVPLEYVYGAIDWLQARLGRDRAIAIMGELRGAELALLVGSRRRDLAAIIAFSPTSVTWPAVGDMTGRIPAWTEHDRPIAFIDLPVADPARQFSAGLADGKRAASAAIPIERARATVLLVSSRDDAIWPAAAMADQLEARLRLAGFPHPVSNLQFDDASHLLMGPGAGVVRVTHGSFSVDFGGSEAGTLHARTSAWTAAKKLLADISEASGSARAAPPLRWRRLQPIGNGGR